jgi:hypothetical protein
MRSKLVYALALGVGTVISVPVALGQDSGGTLTKAQVIEQGSEICRAGEAKVDQLPQISSRNPFAKNAPKGDAQRAIVFLNGYANALAGVRAGLSQLKPPIEGRSLFEGFIQQLGPTITTFRRARSEALAHEFQAALGDVQKAFGLFAKASQKTKAYGFPKGVCQSG